MQNSSRHPNRRLVIYTWAGFFAFFLFGFADNVKGPVIPRLLVDLDLSYAGGSTLLLAAYIGFMAGVLATGLVAARRDNRAALIIAAAALALGAAGTAYGATPLILSGTFFLVGFGLGSIEVGANGLIAALYPAESGRYLNLLAVFHGAGSMIAPFLAGMIISGGVSWRTVYALIVPLAALQAVVFIGAGPSGEKRQTGEPAAQLRFSLLLQRELLLYSLFLTFYVAAEIGVASWMVEYLLRAKGLPMTTGSLMLSGYFALIMCGRFIGSFLVERLGYRRVLIWMTVASVASLSGGILLPGAGAVLVPATGLFFSVMFPTATADAAGRSSAPRSSVFSLLFFCAGLGGMLGPWLVGIGAEFSDIRGGFAVNILFTLLMLIALLAVGRAKKQGTGAD